MTEGQVERAVIKAFKAVFRKMLDDKSNRSQAASAVER